MNDLFGFLVVISFIALISGLIRPSIFASSMKNPTRKKLGLVFGGLLLIFFIAFGLTTDTKSSPKSNEKQTQKEAATSMPTKLLTPTTKPTQKPTEAINTKNGSYTSYDGKTYKFQVLSKTGDEKNTASFTPFVPNKDSNLVEAILRVFTAQYGASAQIDPAPSLESRSGVNLIKFEGDGGDYYVSPIKQDTGEIHSIIFWKE